MSEFYTWTESELGLGVPDMDTEHQQLIDRMNALHAAYAAEAPFATCEKLLNELAQFTVKHFADEEAHMEKIKFEGLPTHKIIHQQLLGQFQSHVEKFKTENVLTDSFFNFLKVWLTSHIRGIDMKYGKHRFKKAA